MQSTSFMNNRRAWAFGLALAAGALSVAFLVRRRRRLSEEASWIELDLDEDWVDRTIEESFPASDPPSWSPVSGAYPTK